MPKFLKWELTDEQYAQYQTAIQNTVEEAFDFIGEDFRNNVYTVLDDLSYEEYTVGEADGPFDQMFGQYNGHTGSDQTRELEDTIVEALAAAFVHQAQRWISQLPELDAPDERPISKMFKEEAQRRLTESSDRFVSPHLEAVYDFGPEGF
jgi:hypothetical protein